MRYAARRRLGLAGGVDQAGEEQKLDRKRVIKIWRLPKDKDEQVAMTIRVMISETIAGAHHPRLRELASYAGIHARNELELGRAYTRLVRERVGFMFDPADVELVRTPGAIADDILSARPVFGDCDDMALLLATLLYSRGIQVAYVTISTSPHNKEFRHVFVAAKIGQRWETFDPSVSRPYRTDGLRHAWWHLPYGAMPPP